MVVRYVTKDGGVMMGPPYTEAEEQDLYRRIAGGPWTVLRSAKAPRSRPASRTGDGPIGKEGER
jgi:hypothetical protein